MLSEERLENIRQMEATANETQQLLKEAKVLLQKWEELTPRIRKMEDYYSSPAWKEDYDASNNGQIPAGMPHGVLSEDGLYNLLEEHSEICGEYQSFVNNFLER